MAEVFDLDVTDASNTTRWPEGMQFRSVNNAGRADEGMLARQYRDTNGSIAASGSSNTYAITSNRTITAYANGLVFGFTANHTSTNVATLNVNGIAAKTIVRPDGTNTQAGDFTSGQMAWVVYVLSLDKFQLLSTPPLSSTVLLAVGSIMAWPTSSIPSNFLLCDGSAVSRTTYSALYAAIGTTYGVGDGSTTFNLPNYQDYFLRGHSATGTDAADRTDRGDGTIGANVGTKQAGEVQEHEHDLTDPGHTHVVPNGTSIWRVSGGTGFDQGPSNAGSAVTITPTDSNATGITIDAEGGTETRPKNITVNWVILAIAGAAMATSGIGANETWIGARSMTPRVSSPADLQVIDSGSSDISVPAYDFDQTSAEYVHFEWVPPARWDKGTVTFKPFWTAAAGTPAQTCIFTLAGVAISNDDPLNGTFGTAVASSDVLIATGDVHVGPESAAVTIGGTPAADDLIMFQIARDISDTLAADARLLGIKLIWNSNATSDD